MRFFLGKHQRVLFILSLIFFSTALLTACGFPQWLTTAQQILPIAVQMALGILTLIGALTGKGLDPTVAAALSSVVSKINSGIQDIQTMVQQYQEEYQNNPTAAKTLLGSIQEGVKVVIDNIDQFLADMGIPDGKIKDTIHAVLTLIATELSAWSSLLPVLVAQAGETVTVTVPFSSKEFKAQYNKIIRTETGDPNVDAALTHLRTL